jgi:mRNA interferase MazF
MRTSERARYAAGDVVVVPFPYADRLAEKRRPALVVSGPQLARFRLLWVVMITSAENRAWSCDVPIGNLTGAGLPAPSVVRPAKVACIEPARILRRAGRLDPAAMRMVARQVREFVTMA